jgi:DNA adenine methylase
MYNLYLACNRFAGNITSNQIYKGTSHLEKIKNLSLYQDKLKNATLLSNDYKAVMKKYDSPSTFFFLDPPYEKSEKLYKESSIDYEDMSRYLKTIKGKFLLTVNDSPNLRQVFKDFNVEGVEVTGSTTEGFQSKRKELIITNYKNMGGTGMNPWISHIKSFAKKHNISYNEALKDAKCKATYKKKN